MQKENGRDVGSGTRIAIYVGAIGSLIPVLALSALGWKVMLAGFVVWIWLVSSIVAWLMLDNPTSRAKIIATLDTRSFTQLYRSLVIPVLRWFTRRLRIPPAAQAGAQRHAALRAHLAAL